MADQAIERILLKNGLIAEVGFLSDEDGTEELLEHINSAIREKTFISYDMEFTLEDEKEWKKNELEKMEAGNGFVLVARVDGRIAATTGATRDSGRSRGNIQLGILVAKRYRGIGLGRGILNLNIRQTRKRFRPKNIYLYAYSPNKSAISLYKKLGFREFAVFRKWAKFGNRYLDQIFMKLEKER